jgi:cytochrome oxidase Cu insertion factor (SCO1/SenC/PrrC family)
MHRMIALASALVLIAAQQDRGRRPEQGKGAEVGKDAPNFKLKATDGKKEVELSKLKGKPVLLIFGSYT